jgi:hypothetical protein
MYVQRALYWNVDILNDLKFWLPFSKLHQQAVNINSYGLWLVLVFLVSHLSKIDYDCLLSL